MRRVLAPPAAGVLAALGLVMAGERRDDVQTVLAPGGRRRRPGRASWPRSPSAAARRDAGRGPLRAAADCRYVGQSHSLTVPWDPEAPGGRPGRDLPRRPTGSATATPTPGVPVEAVTLRLAAERPGDGPARSPPPRPATPVAGPGGDRRWRARPAGWPRAGPPAPTPGGVIVLDRRNRERGVAIEPGPGHPPGDGQRPARGGRGDGGGAGAQRLQPQHQGAARLQHGDLRRRGPMVVQSASIPVHLGAMPEAVDAVRERGAAPGEVWLVNDPYRGGTHLPDLTMISPIAARRRRSAAYAVTRAHHADVGGMAPGSMPAGSRELLQEGLVIPPVRLVRDGEAVPDVLDLLLANTRTPGEREGDLRAQLAAHRLAERRLARGGRAPRRRTGARGVRRPARLRRAAHARGDRRDAGRPLRGRGGPGGRRRRRRTTSGSGSR